MKFPDETLMAYADGELDAATRAAVEEAMRSDPKIAQRIEQHRALRGELGAAFGGILNEPVPDRLVDAAHAKPAGGDSVADLAAARAAKQAPPRRWSWPEWTAIAASVVLGVLAGRTALQPAGAELIAMSDGRLIAAGPLANALSNQLGGARSQGSRIAIAATFRAKSGDYCRAFTASGDALAGLACREPDSETDQWRVHTLTQTSPQTASGPYRMAGTGLPAPVIRAIESTMAGDALDLQEEDAARERGWRD